ncbi:hypothetical protein PMI01_01997 [Caulobacter sp. AP07]|jgi:hypothetical protein|uniref:hypothetical protein n=1 Tax=Caulobacter sp. AP07 TaxID=1144304 RepID=UPI0002720169|nr:hypothetical protein [Caulobacter sp. AP07]EJL33692.1 hypothetical protein PMI01_01997 [Caulobacter sp. AP07]
MKRTEAARAGAEKLKRAEAAIDAALRETAELMGLLPSLRLEAKLSAVLGQDAVANLGETLTHIVSARRTIIEAHGALFTVRAQMGCGALAMGDTDKTGDQPRTSGLHAVSGGRAA